MKIIAVKKDKKHTVKVTLEDHKECNFDIDYWNSTGLHENDELSLENLDFHLKESDYIRAKSRGMWFLEKADYSEKTLYEKIVAGGISTTASARAVARIKELGLIDDERLALRLALKMSEANVSKREAYAKLFAKGIPKHVIKSVLEQTDFDEIAQVNAIIQKKYRAKMNTKEEIQKVYAALIRKGFSYSAVGDAIRKYTKEVETQEEY